MDSFTLTIISGVVVVVIGLFIEYGYFQKRRGKNKDVQTASGIYGKSGGLSWPEAISRAVENFSTLHEGKRVELISTNTAGEIATLNINVWRGSGVGMPNSYMLQVNKAGEIENIKQLF